jgi:phenylpropionate dioxygenase-like ring-hydroxylating dioxygenase large terminal subunit
VAAGWHPVAAVSELRGRPLARRLMGQPLVVFAGKDGPAILRDRCPHRGVPLSAGRVCKGVVECPYHGWRFDERGRCVAIPGAVSVPPLAAERVPVAVRAGLVWTSLAAEPPPFPVLPTVLEDAALDRFWWLLEPSPAGLLDALENHVDPAHPYFIHSWLAHAPGGRRPVKVNVRSGPWGAEAAYAEERKTWTLLRPLKRRRWRALGRLYPPTIGELRLESPEGLTLSIVLVVVPTDAGLVRPWGHFATRRGLLPASVKRGLLKAFHWPILNQDRRLLALQAAARAEQGGRPQVDGPLDLLGPSIRRLAEGLDEPEQSYEIEIML